MFSIWEMKALKPYLRRNLATFCAFLLWAYAGKMEWRTIRASNNFQFLAQNCPEWKKTLRIVIESDEDEQPLRLLSNSVTNRSIKFCLYSTWITFIKFASWWFFRFPRVAGVIKYTLLWRPSEFKWLRYQAWPSAIYDKLITNLAYWPAVGFLRTATTWGQCSPVRPWCSVSKNLVWGELCVIFYTFLFS